MINKWDEGYWDIYSEFRAERSRFKFDHPATFIEAVPRAIIGNWSYEGELVLDPFSGTGTTAVVAQLLNRNYVGIELSSKYHQMSLDRLKKSMKGLGQFFK